MHILTVWYYLKYRKNDIVNVQIDEKISVPIRLKLKDKLSDVRERLKKNEGVGMGDALSFADDSALVEKEREKKIRLKSIVEKHDNKRILHLRTRSEDEVTWNTDKKGIKVQIENSYVKVVYDLDLGDNLLKIRKILEQEDNGINISELSFCDGLAEIAGEDEEMINLQDIIVIDKESKVLYLRNNSKPPNWKFLNEKCKLDYGRIESAQNEFKEAKERAFTMESCEMTEIDGCEKDSKIKKLNFVTNSTRTIVEYGKVSLKYKLKPTDKFIEAVKDVIKSKDPNKFKDVKDKFGQFVSKEVILGGRASFEESNRNKYSKLKLIGGKKFSSEDFDETDWFESLKDFKNWDCIQLKDQISIFRPLSEDLRKQILLLVGKKILCTRTEDYAYYLFEPGMYQTFELKNIPENVLEILRNKDADCSIFATVIDEKEKDIFNCQILWPPNEDPRLIIHCIQKKFKKRECKLKVRWMIVGYDINFNFNRPDFKLCVQKDHFNVSNDQGDQTMITPLDLEYNSSVLCFGTPVLTKLDSSNNSLVIGHHFFNDQENEKIGLYTFSYSLKEDHYVNLPNFSFCTLSISNYSNSDNYGILPILPYQFTNHLKPKPKFISIYSTGENKCGPVFLKQKTNEIKTKYTYVKICDQEKCICKEKKLIELENQPKYAFFDPKSYLRNLNVRY